MPKSPKTESVAPQTRANKRRHVVCTQSLANMICERLAQGESLTSICQGEGMPAHSTILKWAHHDETIQDDASENPENLTGIDKAIIERREALNAILDRPQNPESKPTTTGRTEALDDEWSEQGDNGDKVERGRDVPTVSFREHYAHARVIGYHALADMIRDIADNDAGDLLANGKVDHENINRSRLRVDTYKWLLSKALPKIYGGERMLLERDEGDQTPVILTGNDVDL